MSHLVAVEFVDETENLDQVSTRSLPIAKLPPMRSVLSSSSGDSSPSRIACAWTAASPLPNGRLPPPPPARTAVARPAKTVQLAKTSCGLVLYFERTASVPLGGWVVCPQHGATGVRENAP